MKDFMLKPMLYWHPQLSIDNESGDLKQSIRHTAKKTKEIMKFAFANIVI